MTTLSKRLVLVGLLASTPAFAGGEYEEARLNAGDKARDLAVSSQIEALLRNAYSENYVYLIKKADDQYQVILEVKDEDRNRPEDLAKLYVRSDDGKRTIPLSAVATWEQTLGPQSVNHINQFTSVTFNFNLIPGVPMAKAIDFVNNAANAV